MLNLIKLVDINKFIVKIKQKQEHFKFQNVEKKNKNENFYFEKSMEEKKKKNEFPKNLTKLKKN